MKNSAPYRNKEVVRQEGKEQRPLQEVRGVRHEWQPEGSLRLSAGVWIQCSDYAPAEL